jgi:DNA polymerase-3 subunit beta
MFSLKANVSDLLLPLQQVIGIVERRHTLPILSNALLECSDQGAAFIATDLEVQITSRAAIQGKGSITVSARKLHDILRALPTDAEAVLDGKEGRMTVKAGKSRFNLQTLPPGDYPRVAETIDPDKEISITQKELKRLLGLTQFAMAVQDIRYYLNGLLISISNGEIRAVATDGHRLSFASLRVEAPMPQVEAILPRKTVLELSKLLNDSEEPVRIQVGANQVRFSFAGLDVISKIVEGKFPDYQKVIPQGHQNRLSLDRQAFQQSLMRAAILSNDKLKGVRLVLTSNQLAIICSNNEHEEAEETLSISYDGAPLDIGFNIAYLLDVLSNTSGESIIVNFGEAQSSALIELPDRTDYKYVVMPMRL